MSPSQAFNGSTNVKVVALASVPRSASTILISEGTYYGVAGVCNKTGLQVNGNGAECTYSDQFGTGASQGPQYASYWQNLGNSTWSYPPVAATPADALAKIKSRHSEQVQAQFVDGHAKAIPYKRAVGDICLWTTDADGPHPNCN